MNEPASVLLQRLSSEPLFSGMGRVIAGLLLAAILGLVPTYYVYRDWSRTQHATSEPAESTQADDPTPSKREEAATAQEAVAPRITEEPTKPLSSASPDTVEPSRPISAASDPKRELDSVPMRAPDDLPGFRVPDARPIITTPPDPRDTTRAIEAEARMADLQAVVGERRNAGTRTEEEGRRSPGEKSAASVTRPINPKPSGDDSAQAPAPGATGASVEPKSKPIGTLGTTATAPSSAAQGTDSVEQRMSATREWLASAPRTTHTIQILGVRTEQQLSSELKTLSKALEPEKIYVFRTMTQGKVWFAVAYGSYEDRRSAAQAMQNLPASVAANRPMVRTVDGIRNDQKQHGIAEE